MTVKIPDFILLREAHIEIGKLKAFISELEYELTQIKSISPEERLIIKRDVFYNELKNRIIKNERTIQDLREFNNKLISKINLK